MFPWKISFILLLNIVIVQYPGRYIVWKSGARSCVLFYDGLKNVTRTANMYSEITVEMGHI